MDEKEFQLLALLLSKETVEEFLRPHLKKCTPKFLEALLGPEYPRHLRSLPPSVDRSVNNDENQNEQNSSTDVELIKKQKESNLLFVCSVDRQVEEESPSEQDTYSDDEDGDNLLDAVDFCDDDDDSGGTMRSSRKYAMTMSVSLNVDTDRMGMGMLLVVPSTFLKPDKVFDAVLEMLRNSHIQPHGLAIVGELDNRFFNMESVERLEDFDVWCPLYERVSNANTILDGLFIMNGQTSEKVGADETYQRRFGAKLRHLSLNGCVVAPPTDKDWFSKFFDAIQAEGVADPRRTCLDSLYMNIKDPYHADDIMNSLLLSFPAKSVHIQCCDHDPYDCHESVTHALIALVSSIQDEGYKHVLDHLEELRLEGNITLPSGQATENDITEKNDDRIVNEMISEVVALKSLPRLRCLELILESHEYNPTNKFVDELFLASLDFPALQQLTILDPPSLRISRTALLGFVEKLRQTVKNDSSRPRRHHLEFIKINSSTNDNHVLQQLNYWLIMNMLWKIDFLSCHRLIPYLWQWKPVSTSTNGGRYPSSSEREMLMLSKNFTLLREHPYWIPQTEDSCNGRAHEAEDSALPTAGSEHVVNKLDEQRGKNKRSFCAL